MTIEEAQHEVRTTFAGGAVGQLVSGLLWLLSAAIGATLSVRLAILVLVVGGVFIFPVTQLVLRLSGRPHRLSFDNPLGRLAMQSAFIIPVMIPVALGATLHNPNWFYPAMAVIVGAHYFPFVTLYGMWRYWILGGAMIAVGIVVGLYSRDGFTLAGWLCGVLLLLFAGLTGLTQRKDAVVV
jgi:hypothetical protein